MLPGVLSVARPRVLERFLDLGQLLLPVCPNRGRLVAEGVLDLRDGVRLLRGQGNDALGRYWEVLELLIMYERLTLQRWECLVAALAGQSKRAKVARLGIRLGDGCRRGALGRGRSVLADWLARVRVRGIFLGVILDARQQTAITRPMSMPYLDLVRIRRA